MKCKTWVLRTFFLIILFQLLDSQAQNFSKNINLHWRNPLEFQKEGAETTKLLYFDGSISDYEQEALPMFFEKISVANDYESYDAFLSQQEFEPLTPEEVALLPADFSQTTIEVTASTVVEKKKFFTAITFVPLRRTSTGIEKLVSAQLVVNAKKLREHQKQIRSYAANSVLHSGNWYKVSVVRDGIYKVTYADLVELGAITGSIASSRLSIFGYGGGMLPEDNAKDRFDDLPELPIAVCDGGDGSFDSEDYFLFYAMGPHTWNFSPSEQVFNHVFNVYDKAAFYFINVDMGIGQKLRVPTADYSHLMPMQEVTSFVHYGFIENDLYNIGESGRCWMGDKYDANTTYSYTLPLPSSIISPIRLTVSVGSVAPRAANFVVVASGNTIGGFTVSATNNSNLISLASHDIQFSTSGGNVPLTITYSKPTVSAIGYLNYIEWQTMCTLRKGNGQLAFCNPQAVGNGLVTRFSISNMNANVRVWDVTKLTQVAMMSGNLQNNLFSFNSPTDSLRYFIAFSDNDAYAVHKVGKVSSQNLHANSQVDMIIVAHPDFASQAERLAQFRRENDQLTVKVVFPQQIYNEFSSGAQDITAIRDYMRMIYDKSSGSYPKYLLLFGRPSYDYRDIEHECKMYVPNYQTNSTVINENSFRANDDYFGLLDEDEGDLCKGFVDIAIGRFPVSTVAQAQLAVDKTINYASKSILGENTATCNFGDWKNIVTFVADDEDGTTHIGTANYMAEVAESYDSVVNMEKIYLDAYQQVTYSSSERYPEVTRDINNRMAKGGLLFTYVGHGGKNGWATERIIELTDIQKWKNRYNQPWMITLTCEFGWYDRALLSPAEMAFLNANGGVSAMVTTSRVAFTRSNHEYGVGFFANVFTQDNGLPQTIGEAHRLAKNSAGGASTSLNMIYVMGDPSMRLAVPAYKVVTDSINGHPISEGNDTLRALSRATFSGHIENAQGDFLSDFTGDLYPSIFDKKVLTSTLRNDESSNYFEFYVQKNILFKGKVSVKNGRFRYSFILPKDINYSYGNGKVSYYANHRSAEAAGMCTSFVIGGMSKDSLYDTKGPEIRLFMNDENFVNGGTVNASPTLLVKLHDEYGINTTGNGIGHDLVAVLDGGKREVLNNYYEAERDSFNCGTVRFPYSQLAVGPHKLKVRAWDILNNMSESEIEFTVESDEDLVLNHVLNYPNPFTTNTSFFFEHNQVGATLDILITIYTISGKVVKTIACTQVANGFRSQAIPWDGRDDFGDKLAKGTYLYRLKVRTGDGKKAEKFEKIVIL